MKKIQKQVRDANIGKFDKDNFLEKICQRSAKLENQRKNNAI
jgi:hypothetical protein